MPTSTPVPPLTLEQYVKRSKWTRTWLYFSSLVFLILGRSIVSHEFHGGAATVVGVLACAFFISAIDATHRLMVTSVKIALLEFKNEQRR